MKEEFVINTQFVVRGKEKIHTYIVSAQGETLGEILNSATVQSKDWAYSRKLVDMKENPVYSGIIDLLQSLYVRNNPVAMSKYLH